MRRPLAAWTAARKLVLSPAETGGSNLPAACVGANCPQADADVRPGAGIPRNPGIRRLPRVTVPTLKAMLWQWAVPGHLSCRPA